MKYRNISAKIMASAIVATMAAAVFAVPANVNAAAVRQPIVAFENETYTYKEPEAKTLDIPKTKVNKLKDLPGISGTIPFKTDKKNGVTSKEITATKSGFWSVIVSGGSFELKVKNNLGAVIYHRSSLISGNIVSFELSEGKSYTLDFPSIYTDADVTIVPPKDIVDVTKYNSIDDEAEFGGQMIRYSFTAPKEGTYTFVLDKLPSSNWTSFSIDSEDGVRVKNEDYFRQGNSLTAALKKGAKYIISMTSNNASKYTFSINPPSDVKNITKYSVVNDNLEYTSQVNTYKYVAPYSGNYCFTVSNLAEKIDISIKDDTGKNLTTQSYLTNGRTIIIGLSAGKEYTMKVSPTIASSKTPYTIKISPQKPTVDVTNIDKIVDKCVFDAQINYYTLQVPEKATYTFNYKVNNGGNIDFIINDSKDNRIFKQYTVNGGTHKYNIDLEAGKYLITMKSDSTTPFDYTMNIIRPVNTPNQIEAFVNRIYTYVLDREPEAEGVAFWSGELYNFNRSGAEVAQGFIFSDEFTARKLDDKAFVTVLYKTFFDRDADDAGIKYWVSQLRSGTSRFDVANGFIYSQEWADTCATYGIRSGGTTAPAVAIEPTDATYAFVERMYTTAMERESDSEGKEFWANELSNFRTTGEEVGASFFLSAEMESYNLDDISFLARLYATFMNREGDEDGLLYWYNQMQGNLNRAEVVYGFTRSPEFIQKCIEARILPYSGDIPANAGVTEVEAMG